MKRMIDIIISTQLACTIAYGCVWGAHLIDLKANDNWSFAIYVLLAVAVIFILFPYLIMNEPDYLKEQLDREDRIKALRDELSELYAATCELSEELRRE